MANLQQQLRGGLDAFETKGQWSPFKLKAPVEAPHWFFEQRGDGTIGRSYTGKPSTITIATAADLLAEWWPQLRRCKYEQCREWFLPRHGRQRYHDPACSHHFRQAAFTSKHPRDYHAEYVKRVTREVGKGATPQLRPRKRTKKRKSR